jgi:hypothetical protein
MGFLVCNEQLKSCGRLKRLSHNSGYRYRTMGLQVCEDQHLLRFHTEHITTPARYRKRDRTPAQTNQIKLQSNKVAHAARRSKVTGKIYGRQPRSLLPQHLGIRHTQSIGEPVFHQVVEQNQILRKENNAGWIAMRKPNPKRALKAVWVCVARVRSVHGGHTIAPPSRAA